MAGKPRHKLKRTRRRQFRKPGRRRVPPNSLTKREKDLIKELQIPPSTVEVHIVSTAIGRLETSDYPHLIAEIKLTIERLLGRSMEEAAAVLARFPKPDFLPLDVRKELNKPAEWASRSLIPGPMRWLMSLAFKNVQATHGTKAVQRELALLRQALTGARLGRRRRVPMEHLGLMKIRHDEGLTDREISDLFDRKYTPAQIREYRRQHYERRKPPGP